MPLCVCGCRDGHVHRLDERGMSGDVICPPCGGRVCGERVDLAPPGSPARTRFRFRLWDGSTGESTGVPWRVGRPETAHSCRLSALPCAACIMERGDASNQAIRLAWGEAA